jgi:hypothetical protein
MSIREERGFVFCTCFPIGLLGSCSRSSVSNSNYSFSCAAGSSRLFDVFTQSAGVPFVLPLEGTRARGDGIINFYLSFGEGVDYFPCKSRPYSCLASMWWSELSYMLEPFAS